MAFQGGPRLSGAPGLSGGGGCGIGAEGVGFDWRGRWGWWSKDGVLILATCVGVFELTAASEPPGAVDDAALFEAALGELRDQLQAELPRTAALADVHWTPRPGADLRQKGLRAAVLADLAVCHQLRLAWRSRPLRGGAVLATWGMSFDAASDDQARRVAERLERTGVQHTGILVELPTRWFAQDILYAESVTLARGSHWFNFSELFGSVQEVRLQAASSGYGTKSVYLLVNFVSTDGASNMYMGLSDRYIYNQNSQHDDIHPVICMTGDYSVLGERLRRSRRPLAEVARFQPETMAVKYFVLTRCGRGLPEGALCPPPDQVGLGGSRRQVTVGREDSCDLPIRHPHVSKTHATLVVQEIDGSECMLMVRDVSANGTWINGRRLQRGQGFIQIRPGDKVSFLQPTLSLEVDPITYEVQASGHLVVTPPVPALAAAAMPAASSQAALPVTSAPALDVGSAACPNRDISKREENQKLAAATRAEQPRARSRSHSRALPGASTAKPPAAPAAAVRPKKELATTEETRGSTEMATMEDPATFAQKLHERLAVDTAAGTAGEDAALSIGKWLRSYGLAEYEARLTTQFDHARQIVDLYAANVGHFFEDCNVEDKAHQELFAKAILEHEAPRTPPKQLGS